MKQFKGRPIVAGECTAEALVFSLTGSTTPILISQSISTKIGIWLASARNLFFKQRFSVSNDEFLLCPRVIPFRHIECNLLNKELVQ